MQLDRGSQNRTYESGECTVCTETCIDYTPVHLTIKSFTYKTVMLLL